MTITVEATYENGVLKLKQPLPLPEHAPLRIHIEIALWAEQSAGMMAWKGTPQEADYFAMSPELDFPLAEEEA